MVTKKIEVVWVFVLSCAGCGVESRGADSGGVTESAVPGCPAGLTVLMSDYASTQVALSALDGSTRSPSLVSTASTETSGLAFALSGDVVLPGTPPRSGRVVVIDRFGTNVLTWIDTRTGEIEGQLPVGTGFESNPQDYVEVDARHAFVSRWGQNGDSGRESFDSGSDLLVIDSVAREISNSIAMPAQGDLPPRPGGLFRVGSEVIVSLDPISLDFASTGTAVLVGVSIDEEKVVWEMPLLGLKSCGRLARSPDGRRLALACSGALDPQGQVESIDQSALVLFDATEDPPEEVERFGAEEFFGEPLQSDVEFASDDIVLVKTQTPLSEEGGNRWLAFHLEDGTAEELLQAEPDGDGAGKGLVYGSMVCAPKCSDLCFLADADQAVLQRIELHGKDVELVEPVRVEDRVGLPPRGLVLRE